MGVGFTKHKFLQSMGSRIPAASLIVALRMKEAVNGRGVWPGATWRGSAEVGVRKSGAIEHVNAWRGATRFSLRYAQNRAAVRLGLRRGATVVSSLREMRLSIFPILASLLLLAGCASYSSSIKPDADLSRYRRVWVKSNLNDNRGLGQFICNALRERGIESDVGPLTMMPLNMQAIISFKDSWTWDFKTHMTGLEISLKDTKIDFPIATAHYSGPASFTKAPHEVADKLVGKLFDAKPAKASGR